MNLKVRLDRLEAKSPAVPSIRVVLVETGETYADAWRRQHGDGPVPDADDPGVLWVEFVGVEPQHGQR